MVAISRVIALELLDRVFVEDAYANLLMPKLLKDRKVDSRDAGLAQEIAYGTIRHKNTLDAIICRAADRRLADFDPGVLRLLELGAYQILRTRVPMHAALNETVDQSKTVLNGRATGLVNAVLRRVSERDWSEWLDVIQEFAGSETEHQALEFSHPEWIVTALRHALRADGREAELEHLLVADNEPARINLVQLPGSGLHEHTDDLERHNVSPIGFISPHGNPADLPGIVHGSLRVQDAGSQLVALAVVAAQSVQKGERWLDLCAGPGGKAALLAALAESSGTELICNEPSEHRAKLVSQALNQAGLRAEIRTEDGRHIRGEFDRILVDAPCTGLGALRRRPEARWRRSQEDLADLIKLQYQLIAEAWRALKPGGVLVYSTCSPHQSETTAIIERALREFGPSAELMNANEIIKSIAPNFEANPNRKTAQMWPHIHDTDAMFVAIISKSVS